MTLINSKLRQLVEKEVSAIEAKMIEVRRDLHRHPERSKRENRTSDLVAAYLEGLGLEVTRGKSNLGVVGLLRGARPGKTVALRADMDALRLPEQTGLPFASTIEGVMHACGHDAHTAMLLAVAEVLTRLRHEVPGTVKFLFQPSEEAFPGGALGMIEDGALDNPQVDAIFACHVFPDLPTGQIGVGAGPFIGGVAAINIHVKGKGGHFAAPHLSVDPIVVAAQVIVNLQAFMTRRVPPFEPAVLTFGTIQGGTRDNIIGEEVIIRGNLGAMNTRLRDQLASEIEGLVKGVCQGMGAAAEVQIWLGYPTLRNDGELTNFVEGVARELYGPESVTHVPPALGGEDFAYFAEKVPGTLWRLGCWDQAKHVEPPRLHDSRFELDEKAMPRGVEFMCQVVLGYLSR